MKQTIIRSTVVMLAMLLAFSCAATKVPKDPHAAYLGNWEYAVENLPVDVDGTMVIMKEEGILSAKLVTPMGEAPITDITIEEGVLKASFDAQGNFIELQGTFEGDAYDGLLLVQGGEFPMKATRVVE
jgi:uncharacterized protein YcnI